MKAILGLFAVAALGGIAFAASRASASEKPSDEGNFVTGASGTTYKVVLANSQNTPNGVQQNWQVFDASGLILEYAQFQGDNDHRILVPTPNAIHPQGDQMWLNAVGDFGILVA